MNSFFYATRITQQSWNSKNTPNTHTIHEYTNRYLSPNQQNLNDSQNFGGPHIFFMNLIIWRNFSLAF